MLKNELNEKEIKTSEKFHAIRVQLEAENRSLNEQLEKLKEEHSIEINKFKAQQNQETKTLIEQLIKENESKINEIKARHLEDLKGQTIAQKAAMSSLKTSLEKSKALEIEMQTENFNKKMGIKI
jgi:hypothetical protein